MALTDEERFRFDLTGYLVRESILTPAEVSSIVSQLDAVHHNPAALPAGERGVPGGACSVLIDHPRVVDVLHDIIGPDVRLENCFSVWRTNGERHPQGLHAGGRDWIDPLFGYRSNNGRIYAGLVRVVFELTDVDEADGATCFIPGSHKSNFPLPAGRDVPADNDLVRGYSCPAGSAIFFTEQLLHAGPEWKRDTARVAVLHAYSHVATSFHRLTVRPEILSGLSREKKAWFRDPWYYDFRSGPATRNSLDRFVAGQEPTIDTATAP